MNHRRRKPSPSHLRSLLVNTPNLELAQPPPRYFRMIPLKDIVPAAQNNIDTQFIVLDKTRTTAEGPNKTCLALVADETAAVHFQFWGEECDAFDSGDILRLEKGIFSYNRNIQFVLRAGKRGKVLKVGEFTMVFVETPNMSEIRWSPDPKNPNKYVPEAVLSSHSRIFPPMLWRKAER